MSSKASSRRMKFAYNDSAPRKTDIGPKPDVPAKLRRQRPFDSSLGGALRAKYGPEFIDTLEAIAS